MFDDLGGRIVDDEVNDRRQHVRTNRDIGTAGNGLRGEHDLAHTDHHADRAFLDHGHDLVGQCRQDIFDRLRQDHQTHTLRLRKSE